MKTNNKIEKIRFWTLMWGLGLAGQLCWNIENQWFNTFVYAKIAKDSTIVTLMVITSALVTTFSTFLFGTLSDRSGTRKRYVSIGYIIWGMCAIGFGLTQYIASGTMGVGAKVSVFAAVVVILADDIMSFFGAMGNDAGYNAWSNDMTTDQNRGQIGAALAIQPIIGTIVGTVLGGILIGSNDNYQRLFWTMGLFVIAFGVLSLLLIKDAPTLKPYREGSFWQQFRSAFNFKELSAQKELLLVCVTATIFFIPFNLYFVHMGNWLIYRMGFDPGSMGLIQGLGLSLSSLLVIPAIGFINRNRTPLVTGTAVIINIVGLLIFSIFIRPDTVDTVNLFSVTNLPLFIAVFLVGAGYVLVIQSTNMWAKQLYPEDRRGQFEGMRVTFFTLVPMIIGTVIGNGIIKNGAGSIVNEYGITENIPTESIFMWAAVLVVFTFVPLFFAARMYRQRIKSELNDKSEIK